MKEFPDHHFEQAEAFPKTIEWFYKSDPDPKNSVDLAERDLVKTLADNYEALRQQAGAEEDGLYNYEGDELFKIAYGFREIFINAIYHGNFGIEKNNGEPLEKLAADKLEREPELKNKQVAVRLVMEKDWFEITITDEGRGFDPEKLKNPLDEENILRHQGRGQMITEAFGYEKAVVNTGQGTKVVLKRKLQALNQ